MRAGPALDICGTPPSFCGIICFMEKTIDFGEKTILITGGTGSFGKKFTERILTEYNPKKVVIYSVRYSFCE